MAKFVYADNAATTPVSREVIDAMLPCFSENWGNPSSLHAKGREAKDILDEARATVAGVLGCDSSEIYFTSGGTESDNWAIKGAAMRMRSKGRTHIVTSAIEHHAVLHTCKALEKEGFTVSYVGVDADGVIDLEELARAVNDKTALVSVMYANNEVGTIQPIREIVKICKERKVPTFTDAVQAMGVIDIDVNELGVDMMSFSAHKFGGPKGIGALYIKTGMRIDRLISGGHQERTRRGGTTNVAGMVGFAEALKIAKAERDT